MFPSAAWYGGVVVAAACTLVSALQRVPLTERRKAHMDRPPECGEGHSYFSLFMKCDAAISYCLEYSGKSCVGPANWGCVHPLNSQAGSVAGRKQHSFVKSTGLGNGRCCGGRYQSPIDIPISQARCLPQLPTPRYTKTSKQLFGVFENSGVFPVFRVDIDDYGNPLLLRDVPFTCAVPGSSLYVLSTVSVHVGVPGAPGSEHWLQGKAFDGEIHLVHVRRDFWKPSTSKGGVRPSTVNMRCASQTSLGITVIAVFLSLTEGEKNKELDKFLSAYNIKIIQKSQTSGSGSRRKDKARGKRVRCFCRRRSYEELFLLYAEKGEESQCRRKHYYRLPETTENTNKDKKSRGKFKLKPGLLLPKAPGFYQYFGSLTTPPCSEVVNWIVMKQPLRVTLEQLNAIRELESQRAATPIGVNGNVRPVLPANGRLVTTNGPAC